MRVAKGWASRVLLISGSLCVAACSSSGGGSTPGGGTPPATTTIDEKEPNDGPTAAGAQDIGTFGDDVTIVIKGTLATGGVDATKYTGDLDVFAFELTENGSLDISVDWTGSADVDFALYDAAVKTVASDGTTAKPAKGTLGSAKGKYLLGLFSKDQAATYTATLVYKKTTGTTPPGDCPTTPVAAAAPTGGCNISLTTPVCATADLTGGKDFELDWSTNMTFCEGPHKIQVGGDPPSTWTTGNALEWSVASTSTSDRAQMTRDSGGFVKFNASEIAALTSASGIYYYRVVSFYGSASEARAFRVVK